MHKNMYENVFKRDHSYSLAGLLNLDELKGSILIILSSLIALIDESMT